MNDRNPVGLLASALSETRWRGACRAAGFAVLGYAPRAAGGRRWPHQACRPAESVAEVRRLCGRIVLQCCNTQQVEEVVEGAWDCCRSPHPPGLREFVMNLSTCDPERIAALAARSRARELNISGDAHLRQPRPVGKR